MKRLEGKVAYITGAGAGIGKASARLFCREGARVGILELDSRSGKAAEKEINDAGGEAFFIQTDVTDNNSIAAAIGQVAERFGRIDVIVNCAGGSVPKDVPVHEMDIEIWKQTINLNLLHPFLSCRHGIPHLIRAGGGSIINFSSVLGLMGSVRPAYAAAKGGIIAFTKTLAAQYAGHGIRVNAIAPGGIITERTAKQHAESNAAEEEKRRQLRKAYPFGSGRPEDIADIVLFLASDESRMMTGGTLAAEGGRSFYFRQT